MAKQILVPDLGESVTEADVGAWLKREGDRVAVGEAVVTLDTDKADLEVGAEAAGVLESIEHGEGDTVRVGDVLGVIGEKGGDGGGPGEEGKTDGDEDRGERKARRRDEESRDEDHEREETGEDVKNREGEEARQRDREGREGEDRESEENREREEARRRDGEEAYEEEDREREEAGEDERERARPRDEEDRDEETPSRRHARATPVAERVAAEQEIEITRVRGTGRGGRVTKQDVLEHVEGDAARVREGERERRPEERQRMSRRRRTIARRLVEAQRTAAALTTFNDVDMSAVVELRRRRGEAFQERHGVRLGITSFFVRAATAALERYPRLNAEIQGEEIVLKRYYDIGIAVGASGGLVVPVLRDADRLSLAEIEKRIDDLARRAEREELSVEDLRGGTFSITNGGIFGSLLSTPILNPPQVGILGLHRIEERPVAVDGRVALRPMMYLALGYDHRIVDGREAVRFLGEVKRLIEDPEELLLES